MVILISSKWYLFLYIIYDSSLAFVLTSIEKFLSYKQSRHRFWLTHTVLDMAYCVCMYCQWIRHRVVKKLVWVRRTVWAGVCGLKGIDERLLNMRCGCNTILWSSVECVALAGSREGLWAHDMSLFIVMISDMMCPQPKRIYLWSWCGWLPAALPTPHPPNLAHYLYINYCVMYLWFTIDECPILGQMSDTLRDNQNLFPSFLG